MAEFEHHCARLAGLLDSAEDALIASGPERQVEFWNHGAERLFGYSRAEMLGQPLRILVPPDRDGEDDAIWDRILRGERLERFQTVRRHKDGRLLKISLAVCPTRDGGGRITGASLLAREISHQEQGEHQAGHLAALLEFSTDAIIGQDLEGAVQSWNAGAERLYGYTAAEMQGRSIGVLLPPDRPDEAAGMLQRVRHGERVEHFEAVRIRKDGTPVRVWLTVFPIRNPAGEVVGASHIARELTEGERWESEAAQLAAIVESSDDAIISKNLDGIILTWNAGAERVYGYAAAEARSRPMTMLLPPDRPDEESGILERLKRGERVEHFETVRIRKDGRPIHVSLSISPIRDRQGRVRGASHVARDITERKGLEAQLQQTQKLESLGVLAGGVAHDFNNLLTGILGNASLALDALRPASPARRLIEDVMKAAERASALTRQLLAYAGKGRFVTEHLNLSELVREISSLVQTSIPRKVQLRLELMPDLPPVEADPGQMQQVIMNLVINAAEAIGEHVGTVIVSTGVQEVDDTYIRTVWISEGLAPGRYVALEVHDTGCGMDAATLERIFDPFFTTKFTGRGLGLAAVTGIVRGHRGALKVYSAPGQGSTFKLLFPVADRAGAIEARRERSDLHGQGTVLVVDDEEAVRQTARNTLEHYGYRVLLARDGQEAVEVFRDSAEHIDLVLLDLTMPRMGGEEVLRHLTAIRPSVRVVLSSGFNEVEAVRHFTGKGLAGFIQKPYSAARLARRIKEVLAG